MGPQSPCAQGVRGGAGPSAWLPLLRDDSHRGRRGASRPTPRRHERDPCYYSDTLLEVYCFRSSSSSMISAKELTSRAPTIGMPLMKKVGVSVTPHLAPASASFCTPSLYLPLSRQALNLSLSMPEIPPAVSIRSGWASFAWLANMALCISQNFPCSLAHSDAWAAMLAFWWNGSG